MTIRSCFSALYSRLLVYTRAAAFQLTGTQYNSNKHSGTSRDFCGVIADCHAGAFAYPAAEPHTMARHRLNGEQLNFKALKITLLFIEKLYGVQKESVK